MSPQELGKLIDVHGPALVLYARQWCAAPEDVVQEAYLKLVRLGSRPDEPVAWLYQVVRRGAMDAGKTSARRQRREAAVARSWFIEPELEGLDAASAVAALERLPDEEREVVVAHLWGGLTFEQIGTLVGCSASTAHRRFQAVLTSLRERLGVPCPQQTI